MYDTIYPSYVLLLRVYMCVPARYLLFQSDVGRSFLLVSFRFVSHSDFGQECIYVCTFSLFIVYSRVNYEVATYILPTMSKEIGASTTDDDNIDYRIISQSLSKSNDDDDDDEVEWYSKEMKNTTKYRFVYHSAE